jgi:hypothetical protein
VTVVSPQCEQNRRLSDGVFCLYTSISPLKFQRGMAVVTDTWNRCRLLLSLSTWPTIVVGVEWFGPQVQHKLIVPLFALISCTDLRPSAVYTEISEETISVFDEVCTGNPPITAYISAVWHLKCCSQYYLLSFTKSNLRVDFFFVTLPNLQEPSVSETHEKF